MGRGCFSCGAGSHRPAWNKNASRGAVKPSISIRAGGVSATPPASFLCVLYFLGICLQNKFVKERTKANEETHCIAASALVMVLSLVPMSVFAADNHDGQVHVIVENTTYPEAEGAPWEGTLVEEWIDLNEDSTMMGCVVEALEKNGCE